MWELDAWVLIIKLGSGQKCRNILMMEHLMGFGWHMRRMCSCGVPSPTDRGTLGEML